MQKFTGPAFASLLFLQTIVAAAQQPLPDDPYLAAWTQQLESISDEIWELRWISQKSFHAPGESFPTVDHIRALWKPIAKTLPKYDPVRRQCAHLAGSIVEQFNQEAVIEFAIESEYPIWASVLYEKLGDKKNAEKWLEYERSGEATHDHEQAIAAARNELEKTCKRLGANFELATKHFDTISSGQFNLFGFSNFVKDIPENDRLKLAMLPYFRPSVACGCSPIEGDLDITEPLLRLTAKVAPEKLVQRYGQQRLLYPSFTLVAHPRVAGDVGLSGNILRVAADLVELAPSKKAGLLEAANGLLNKAKQYGQSTARFESLVDFLQSDLTQKDFADDNISTLLNGTEKEITIALAWLPNFLTEQRPNIPPFSAAVQADLAERSKSITSTHDKLNALACLEYVEREIAIESLLNISRIHDREVYAVATDLLRELYRQAHAECLAPQTGWPIKKPELFERYLPQICDTFYPYLAENQNRNIVTMLVELEAPELDLQLAKLTRGLKKSELLFVNRIQWIFREDQSFECTGKAICDISRKEEFQDVQWLQDLAKRLKSK